MHEHNTTKEPLFPRPTHALPRGIQHVLGALALLLLPCLATAQVPERMHYQGFLTTASGIPIECIDPATCDSPVDLTFRIYADPIADVLLWEEDVLGVVVIGGSFNVTLG